MLIYNIYEDHLTKQPHKRNGNKSKRNSNAQRHYCSCVVPSFFEIFLVNVNYVLVVCPKYTWVTCFSFLLGADPYFLVIYDLIVFAYDFIYRFGGKLTCDWG